MTLLCHLYQQRLATLADHEPHGIKRHAQVDSLPLTDTGKAAAAGLAMAPVALLVGSAYEEGVLCHPIRHQKKGPA